MQLVITGRHTNLNDHEKALVEEKMEKFPRKLSQITKIEVVFNVESDRHDLEVIMHVPHSNPLIAHASASSNTAALDLVIDKLDKLVSKHNGKLHNHNKTDR